MTETEAEKIVRNIPFEKAPVQGGGHVKRYFPKNDKEKKALETLKGSPPNQSFSEKRNNG
jgi:hypothetical protein